jgi:hypothetical protein
MPKVTLVTPIRDTDGKLYRAGKDVEVPAELAKRLGFTPTAAAAAQGAGSALPSVPKLAEHIAGMSAEEVAALQATDERATAAAIYAARLAELAAE